MKNVGKSIGILGILIFFVFIYTQGDNFILLGTSLLCIYISIFLLFGITKLFQVIFLTFVAMILTNNIFDKNMQKGLVVIFWIGLIVIGYKKYKKGERIW